MGAALGEIISLGNKWAQRERPLTGPAEWRTKRNPAITLAKQQLKRENANERERMR